MAQSQNRPTSFRLDTAIVAALKAAAEKEHRSQANMLEVMVREYCSNHGIAILKQNVGAGEKK